MRKIPHWLEGYSEAESVDLLSDLADLAASQAGPKGATLRKLIREKRLAEVVCNMEVDYSETWNAEELRYYRQALALFTKLNFLDIGIDKRKAAIEVFQNAETRCRETNEIFKLWSQGRFVFDPVVEHVFHRARDKIATVLGGLPKLSSLQLRFGPGATTLTKKREASIKRKLGDGVSCSEDLLPWVDKILAEMPELCSVNCDQCVIDTDEAWWSVPVLVQEGAISFVLKNAKILRSIETQPTLNGMAQLALGDHMSGRLRKFGIDLRDQSRSREAARVGSLTGEIATLDLSSASDTIAIELVAHLFPIDWFFAFMAFRTGRSRVAGLPGSIKLEKISAMGNGFTFPLESLLFWALSVAATEVVRPRWHKDLRKESPIANQVVVYGDDIAVPSFAYSLLSQVLHAAGFVVNPSKSYATGPFRESCGADYYQGIDIRPVYVKEILTPASLFALHNGFVRRGMRDLAEKVRSWIHPDLQLVGPDGYGDGHLLAQWHEPWGRKPHRNRGFGGTIFDTFARIPKRDFALREGDKVLPQYSIYTRGASPLVPRVPGMHVGNFASLRGKPRHSPGAFIEVSEPSLDIPSGDIALAVDPTSQDVEVSVEAVAKATTFPGTDGYKKIAIYIFG